MTYNQAFARLKELAESQSRKMSVAYTDKCKQLDQENKDFQGRVLSFRIACKEKRGRFIGFRAVGEQRTIMPLFQRADGSMMDWHEVSGIDFDRCRISTFDL